MTPGQLTFGFFYNIDRALASLMGAPYEETMSSQIGRRANGTLGQRGRWFFKACAWVLNTIDKGHTEHAINLADALVEARTRVRSTT